MSHSPQNVRGQVRNLYPRQNQKPCVVCDEADVAPPRFRTPTDVAVAAAEMCIASGLGMSLQQPGWGWFEEKTGTYLLEVLPDQVDAVAALARQQGCGFIRCGQVSDKPVLELAGQTVQVEEMTQAWRGTLDW